MTSTLGPGRRGLGPAHWPLWLHRQLRTLSPQPLCPVPTAPQTQALGSGQDSPSYHSFSMHIRHTPLSLCKPIPRLLSSQRGRWTPHGSQAYTLYLHPATEPDLPGLKSGSELPREEVGLTWLRSSVVLSTQYEWINMQYGYGSQRPIQIRGITRRRVSERLLGSKSPLASTAGRDVPRPSRTQSGGFLSADKGESSERWPNGMASR